MLDVGRHSVDIPLTKRLSALGRTRSLRDPVTSSLRKVSASAANFGWESPSCRNASMPDGVYDNGDIRDGQLDSASSIKGSGKVMISEAELENEFPGKRSGRPSLDFKDVEHDQACEKEMEEPRVDSLERWAAHENAPKRRHTYDGQRGLLHNWRNQAYDDKADEFVEDTIEIRDPAKTERRGRSRRQVDTSEIHALKRDGEHNSVENSGEKRRITAKQVRRDRSFKKTVSNQSTTTPSSVLTDVHNSARALFLLSLEEEQPCNAADFCNGDSDVGFVRMHRRPSDIDCVSRLVSPLLTREAGNSREQTGKCGKKPNTDNLSKGRGRQKDDSCTPTSTCSFNRNEDCKSSVRGSCDGTAFMGDDEMDGLDLPRHGCGIPCYWSRIPKHRNKIFLDCAGRSLSCGVSDSVRRKANVPTRNKMALQKDSTLSSCTYKRSLEKLNSALEALPLLTDGGDSAAFSGEDGSDGPFDVFGGLYSDEAVMAGRRRSRYRSQKNLELALTSESRELAIYADMHRSLSQKYRPRGFDELVGQNMVVQSLVNAVLKGKVAPVYLFQGPRGTGKTSTARIFASALNCLSLEELRPCGFCRECTAFASGKSVNVREVDAANSNGIDRVKALLKSMALTPPSSRFKIFIIDECHMLACETWTTLLKILEEPPGHAVFIFITTDPDKLPRTAVSRCQKYLFPKIKDSEIVSRLQKLAIEENLDVDTDALDLIAVKSDGSLRDAETMLDQLSLLGQRITLSQVHELVGVVSDEKLLDLLDLAFSSDAASTVRRARELMSSGIEPMALMSQLATLIMDILAGSYKLGDYKCKGIFFHRHALTEEQLERLRRALRILSEAEKQLRASNDQITWLTAALLQFCPGQSVLFPNSAGTSVIQSPRYLKNRNEKGLLSYDSPARQTQDKEQQLQAQIEQLDSMTLTKPRTSHRNGSSMNLVFMHSSEENKSKPVSNSQAQSYTSEYSTALSGCVGGFRRTERAGDATVNVDDNFESGQTELMCINTGKLDDIWRRTIEECHSSSLRHLLHTEGKLVSISAAEGLVIAQLEFWHPDHVSRAERSWKSITNSLQRILGCDVEVKINLASLSADADNLDCRRVSTELSNSSFSRHRKSSNTTAEESRHQSQNGEIDSDQRMSGESFKKTECVGNGSQFFSEIHQADHKKLPIAVANGSQFFSEIHQADHKKLPIPAQHFQEGMLSAINMDEGSNQSTSYCNKQGCSRSALSEERKLGITFSQEMQKNSCGLSHIPKAQKRQIDPQDATGLQNRIASSGITFTTPLGAGLRQKERIQNCESQALEPNAITDSQIKQKRVRTDDDQNLCSGFFNQHSSTASFEDGDLAAGSDSESAGILCWKARKFDQEKEKQRRGREHRKSHMLLWVVPCAKPRN